MKSGIILLLLLIDTFINGFQIRRLFPMKYTVCRCIMANKHSVYNCKIVSNHTREIDRLYTTYDNKHSIVFYKDGGVDEILNKTLKLKYDYDILNVFIVSNKYFLKVYNDLYDIKNKTI
jgi:hypothetical protein